MLPLLAAGLISGIAGAAMRSGAKPRFGSYTYIDPGKEQLKTIASNRKAFAEAGRLGETVNEYNQQQLMEQLQSVIPDLPQIQQNVSKNIASMTAGEIPQDVAEQVSRTTAARSFAGGYGGTRFMGNLRTRDLGLTSLNMTQKGLDNATRWIATAKAAMTAPQFDVTSMFLSPSQMVELKFKQEGAALAQRNMQAAADSQYSMSNLLGGVLGQAGGAMTGIGLGQAGAQSGTGSGALDVNWNGLGSGAANATNAPWG